MLRWSFEGLPFSRVARLAEPFKFADLADRLACEARRISFKKVNGTHEAKGCWRAEFKVDVSPDAFDLFFNSPSGYRGRYLNDIAEGEAANAATLRALAKVLGGGLDEPPPNLEQAIGSLTPDFAKVWIDESVHFPADPVLIVEVKVPAWEAAATTARGRLDAHDATLTPKEIDRIFGVRAPLGTVLKVMGAWIRSDGSFFVVPSKRRRGEDIHDFGVS
jgi:hypothetical protein